MRLNILADNEGARKRRMRVGRGPASGKGKTAGRGVKGQKSRTGVAIKGFEGGQTPLTMRMPKRGFNPLNKTMYQVIHFESLHRAIDAKKLDISKPITKEELLSSGVINRKNLPVKLLASGELKAKISIHVDQVSKTAEEAVKAKGGTVVKLA